MRSARGALVVFAKAPRPGEVKTRMCPPLSRNEAAELYANMLADVLEASARFALELRVAAILAVHPAQGCAALAREAPTPFCVVSQRGRNLAERMAWAVREAAASGMPRVLLRGSDSPTLTADALASALDALDACDVVLRPDLDGGYNLVGLRKPAASIFEHPMSTSHVLEDTAARARALGLRVQIGEPGFDLDTVADLRWLARERDRAASLCPRTLAFADERELWRHLER
jgi:rSAM/selenodomain-associated transferase 1